MKRPPLVVAVLVLAAGVASAQPLARVSTARTLFGAATIGRSVNAHRDLIPMPTVGSVNRAAPASPVALANWARPTTAAAVHPWHPGIDFDVRSPIGPSVSPLTLAAEARFWNLAIPRKVREANIDWVGLLSQQTRVDAIMHGLRLQQPKFHDPLYHSAFFKGYGEALKGYCSSPLRWNDGDDFMTNDVGHPVMGAVFSYTFTDYDRRCSDMVFGEGNYWSCMKRATIYASLASANWEWNPVMSESALGHIGKFYTCKSGKCQGEGGWTDLVMTPLGGMAIRLAGDLARARLWPVLDRKLSGGGLAKALNYTLKTLTAPSHFLNCAFKLDFRNAWSPASPRRTR